MYLDLEQCLFLFGRHLCFLLCLSQYLDLNKCIIKLKANYFTALLTPFGRFKQKTINLDEIIGVSLNVDVDISSNNNITKFYSVNITGAFGAKNVGFLTRENAQSLYSMIITACNLH